MGLSQTVEFFYTLQGLNAALDVARERSGRWFDPALVRALTSFEDDNEFWRRVHANHPEREVAEFEPADHRMAADEAMFDRIAEAFAQVVDAKSPWTYRHSSGVANIAIGIAEALGLGSDQQRAIRRMGLLHDIGKLGVSNTVFDKPGKLDEKEFAELKSHPHHTLQIVRRVSSLEGLADMAAAHHEKLDGTGYHRGIAAAGLPVSARLLAVADIFEALIASRPYRDGMPLEKVKSILNDEAGTKLCEASYEGLLAWLDRRDYECRVGAQLEAIDDLLADL